mgnify:CR=1 FL=1|tara:strand:+ start:829 stop:1065 length:237 start_codon:yes stop_codon:yes gene_type:complete
MPQDKKRVVKRNLSKPLSESVWDGFKKGVKRIHKFKKDHFMSIPDAIRFANKTMTNRGGERIKPIRSQRLETGKNKKK